MRSIAAKHCCCAANWRERERASELAVTHVDMGFHYRNVHSKHQLYIVYLKNSIIHVRMRTKYFVLFESRLE